MAASADAAESFWNHFPVTLSPVFLWITVVSPTMSLMYDGFLLPLLAVLPVSCTSHICVTLIVI